MSSAPTEIAAPTRILAKDMRARLMRIVYDELEKLPQTLADMEPTARVACVLKLLPFAAPKFDDLTATYGEPLDWEGVDISNNPLLHRNDQ